jgi:hypothetical protein
MDVVDFRVKIKSGIDIFVEGKKFTVREVVRFRFDDGSFYTKCFLSGGFVLADDLDKNAFALVKEEATAFLQPFPLAIEFKGKKFNFVFTARATAQDTQGEDIFKKGDSEVFWDYLSKDGDCLSLGINEKSNERSDMYGKIIAAADIKF